MKPPEETARDIFAAYNKLDDDTTHITVHAEEIHTLALAFCSTVRELELVNQMLVDHELNSLASRSRIERHMREVGA